MHIGLIFYDINETFINIETQVTESIFRVMHNPFSILDNTFWQFKIDREVYYCLLSYITVCLPMKMQMKQGGRCFAKKI